MCPDKTHLATNLRRVFGSAPPEKITQEAYEGNPKHLRRLARLRRGEKAEVSDLWKYTQDLLYTEIQGPLFAYLLPFCLEAWREDFAARVVNMVASSSSSILWWQTGKFLIGF
jgi:hypothetical protein